MGFEDKPLMDEFVALYIGISGNKSLERQFRESLNVSVKHGNVKTLPNLISVFCGRMGKMRVPTTCQKVAIWSDLPSKT